MSSVRPVSRPHRVPRLHCITDFTRHDDADLALARAVAVAGVDAIQVRAKQTGDRELAGFCSRLLTEVAGLGTRVIVDDRVDVALATGAHGVHLGAEDLPVAAVRAVVPAGFLIGATCRDPGQAAAARTDGADYAGVGPVYPTTTKAGLPAPIGLEVLRATAVELPAIAIAGITADRVPEVLAAGAHGVAVVAAVWGAPDPVAAAAALAAAVHAR